MKVFIQESSSGRLTEAAIDQALAKDMPLKKDGWNFTWKRLYTEDAYFYKLTTKEAPGIVEGMLMLSLIDGEMVYMNNIEVAPHNYGKGGKFINVAGCLLAFACYKSFELGRGHYVGFLSFESKTKLIKLYQEKYGAIIAMGQKMFFDPEGGKKLMRMYLKMDF